MNKKVFSNKKLVTILILVLVVATLVYLASVFSKKGKQVSQDQIQDNTEEQKTAVSEETLKNEAEAQKTSFNQTVRAIEPKVDKGTATDEDLMNLGIAYYNLQKTDQALKTYTDLVNKAPENASAYKNIGNIYRDRKEYREAEDSYRKAIAIDPKFTVAYVNLAYMFFSIEGNKEGALTVLREGLALAPDNEDLKKLYGEYSK